jgi:hypothetical protein
LFTSGRPASLPRRNPQRRLFSKSSGADFPHLPAPPPKMPQDARESPPLFQTKPLPAVISEPCGTTENRQRTERVNAMAHNGEVYDVRRRRMWAKPRSVNRELCAVVFWNKSPERLNTPGLTCRVCGRLYDFRVSRAGDYPLLGGVRQRLPDKR